MTEAGHSSQVVKVTANHQYVLDEHELEEILLAEEVRDLPVVVVSVAGAYRGGKSFLLNFFLRYLTSSPTARADGSWLGDDTEPLLGFKWRTGIKRTTMGILMWSEPILTTLSTGEKVAVLLVDTQGTFDSKSTVRDCSTIFALSTLLSSIQIYNLSQNIQEDDLQHLQLFTEYGRMVSEQGGKAFQVLEFLVRDWQFPFDYPFGATGGEQLLQEKLEIDPELAKEMQDLRQHIRASFEKVSCFLMPHPGFKVLKPDYQGNIDDIDPSFRMHLIELVASLFGPEKLLPKTINGVRVKAKDLFQYFKTYMELFNSDKIPNPTSIMKATVEAGLLSAMNEARDVYEKGMDAECGPSQPSVPAADLQDLHLKYLAAARADFTNKKKMGSKTDADTYLNKLTMELEKRLPQFMQSNLAKIQEAINKAKEAYEESIQNVSKDKPLCIHPSDLERIHNVARDAAIKIFDAARKKISNREDVERTKFVKNFEKRYEQLRLTNERNNKSLVKDLRMEYWQKMQEVANRDPPVSVVQFTREHDSALRQALADFETNRNLPNEYTGDVDKYNLTTGITNSFISLKAMNKSKNKNAMQTAVAEYDSYMKRMGNTSDECLHPDDLKREHQNALCRALVAFRPSKECSAGFDYNDEDEVTLMEILRDRKVEFESLNESANNAAVQEAYNTYVSLIDDKCRPNLWWLLVVPLLVNLANRNSYHEESKSEARNVFYSKRRSQGYHASDSFMDNLNQLMDSYYSANY